LFYFFNFGKEWDTAWSCFGSGSAVSLFVIMNKENNTSKRTLVWSVIIILSVILDQLTKYLAVCFLKPIDTFPIIRDVLHLTYVTNRGAAFGMLSDNRWIFMVVSTVSIVLLGYYLYKKRDTHPLLCTALSFIIGGGIGNMIDRTMLGYVVDFIDFRVINFAVFNIADSFVCVGCAFIFLWLFFFADKEEKKSAVSTETKEKETEENDADH